MEYRPLHLISEFLGRIKATSNRIPVGDRALRAHVNQDMKNIEENIAWGRGFRKSSLETIYQPCWQLERWKPGKSIHQHSYHLAPTPMKLFEEDANLTLSIQMRGVTVLAQHPQRAISMRNKTISCEGCQVWMSVEPAHWKPKPRVIKSGEIRQNAPENRSSR